jgi:hypothetical protein
MYSRDLNLFTKKWCCGKGCKGLDSDAEAAQVALLIRYHMKFSLSRGNNKKGNLKKVTWVYDPLRYLTLYESQPRTPDLQRGRG